MSIFTELLKTEHATEHGFIEMKRQYTLPKIYHGGDNFDLKKRWYVYFSYRNPETDLLERQPNIYMSVNQNNKTVKERLRALKLIQKNLTKLLKEGHSPYQISAEINEKSIKNALLFAFEIKKRTLSDTSIPDYRSKMNAFIKFLEENSYDFLFLSNFKRKYIIDYLNEISETKSAKTRNNALVVISSLFEVMKDNELISENLAHGINYEKTKPVRHKTFSDSQLDKLFAEIEKDKDLFLFIQFVSYNFLRPIEVVRLRYCDLKLESEPAYLEFKAKNKPIKIKIIPEIMLKELQKFKTNNSDDFIFKTNDKGIETQEVNRRNYFSGKFSAIKKKFKLGEEYTVYSFRHTFITKLYREIRKEKNLLETYDILMKITGHSTLEALKKYLRDIDAELAEDYSGYLK